MRYIDEYDAESQYDEMLDDLYGEVEVAGLSYETSRVLKEIDPIAYRTGFVDWLDAEGLTTDESEADETDDDDDEDDEESGNE